MCMMKMNIDGDNYDCDYDNYNEGWLEWRT